MLSRTSRAEDSSARKSALLWKVKISKVSIIERILIKISNALSRPTSRQYFAKSEFSADA